MAFCDFNFPFLSTPWLALAPGVAFSAEAKEGKANAVLRWMGRVGDNKPFFRTGKAKGADAGAEQLLWVQSDYTNP